MGRNRETSLWRLMQRTRRIESGHIPIYFKEKRGFTDGLHIEHEVKTQKLGQNKLSFTKTRQTEGRMFCHCCFGTEGEARVACWTF